MCRTVTRKNLEFGAPGVIAKANVAVPRCPRPKKTASKTRKKAKRTTYNLRLTALGAGGDTIDRLRQRIGTCR